MTFPEQRPDQFNTLGRRCWDWLRGLDSKSQAWQIDCIANSEFVFPVFGFTEGVFYAP